jgi:hypothetical protein
MPTNTPTLGSGHGFVLVKAGVTFTTIAPAGFRLLAAIERAARELQLPLMITSACDGEHSGPHDPHHRGEAYDLRTRDLTEGQKDLVLMAIITACSEPGAPPPFLLPGVKRSLATALFFGFVEAPRTPNEHIHVQLRQGRTYP